MVECTQYGRRSSTMTGDLRPGRGTQNLNTKKYCFEKNLRTAFLLSKGPLPNNARACPKQPQKLVEMPFRLVLRYSEPPGSPLLGRQFSFDILSGLTWNVKKLRSLYSRGTRKKIIVIGYRLVISRGYRFFFSV